MSIQDKLREFMFGKLQQHKDEGAAFMKANGEKPGIFTLPEGIQYEVVKEGQGPKPAATGTVTAHYKGSLLSGKEFDSSFRRNQPFTAPLRSLIKGWQIVLPLMNEGSYWRIWIPSDLAYGDRGAGGDIPGGATLVFEIELLKAH